MLPDPRAGVAEVLGAGYTRLMYLVVLFRIREKTFREMKKDVGMTTAQKSKETRRIEMGSIFVLYIHPTIPTYTYITAL